MGWGGLKHAAAGRALESVDPALLATKEHRRARVRDLVGKPPTNGSEILSYQPGASQGLLPGVTVVGGRKGW